MSKGQTKKTREAAGNRRKLTRAEKKQIAEAIRKAKGDGKARTAQQTIPYLAMYPDGICKVTEKRYSKCVVFEDINYQLAQADDKTAIFENWCDFLNYFDASVSVQLSFINQGTQREQAEKAITIPAQEDAFNSIRTEYSDMLKNQLSKGNNGLVKHKYITFTVEADNKAAAKSRLSRIETDVFNNFKVLGVTARPLSGYERLKVLHGVFHPEGEPFSFSFDWLTPSGLSTKDFIAPSSFRFGEGRYFRMGKKIGAASFLEILAPELNDRMLADILDLETGVIVNLHIRSIDQSEAIKTIKRKITDLDKMKIEEQKKAVRSGYDMDIIPSDLATFGSEAKNLLQDLQSRNERMFLLTFLVVNMADTKRKLENDIFAAAGIAQKYNCRLTRLDYQQEAGLLSSVPIGENLIPIQRGLTTSSTAIFIPFITQELFQTGQALYYGLNALSNNMILCDRKQLKNPNGLILGTPGSGKSFAAKREMTNAFLITDDDIIICDPEAEYFSLVQRLNGQVIRLSPTGRGIDGKPQYVNPMDINLNYSEDDNPLALKSDFILSLCELVIGGKEGLQPVDKTVIDRAVRNVYRPFLADPDPAKMPILGDLYDELLRQPEPEAARIAAALELYVSGSLNVFNHRTNVELSNRLVCIDIKQLGKQLKKLGIFINEGMDELQNIKTAIHEIAHATLHDTALAMPERPDRRTREVQAESVAYAVCQHYGLDTSDYSFGYIAGWSSGKELAELKGSLETIRSTAASLIDTIDGHFAEIQKAQDKEQTTEQAQPAQEAAKQPETKAAAPELPEETAPVQEKEAQPEQAAPAAPYYTINEAAAKRAKDMNSFSDYKQGSATAEYRHYVDEAVQLAERQKQRVDPMYHEKIDSLLDTYARKLAANMNKGYEIDARVPSILIAGGSNFPTRKKEKQNAARDSNYREWQDIQGLLDKIRSTGMGGISADDPQAVQKLEKKLESLEKSQETMKAVNAYYRKHKTLDGCPHLPPEELEKLKADMASSWHLEDKPFATWALSNNSAEIRRVKDRIKSLSQQKEIGFVGWEFDGGKVEANTEANRLQIFFEDKPDEATREALKSNGFRWSPKAGAWQRQLTSNAYYAADYVKAIAPLTGEKPTELQRAHIRQQKVAAQEQPAQEQPEQEAPQDKDTFSIYQIKGGDETRDLRFEPYDRLIAAGHRVDPKNYALVYSAPLTPGTSLEDIYTRFNIDHPKDFKGHSLSVSDVVVLHQNGQDTAHYVDSFGYKKVPEFLQPENYLKTAEQTTEQNYNMIDGQINNTPTVAELEAKVKTGETISLVDLAETVKADKERGKAAKTEKKPSIRAQLKAAKEQTPKKQAKQKTQDLERS